jgi:hypothetical protein
MRIGASLTSAFIGSLDGMTLIAKALNILLCLFTAKRERNDMIRNRGGTNNSTFLAMAAKWLIRQASAA